MKLSYCILPLVFLLTSCYDVEKPKKPSDLLSQDEMVAILVDMSMMSSAKGIDKKKIENSGIVPDEYIFKKHNIDSVRFNNSNNFYAYNIDKYSEIYKQVKDSLTVLRDHYKAIDTKEKKEKAKQDSIKKVERAKRDSIYKVNGKTKKKTPVLQKSKKLQSLKKEIKKE